MEPQQPEHSTVSQDSEQPDKPLGRGLEQISHLFLTQKNNFQRAREEPPVPLPEPQGLQAPSRAHSVRTILLRQSTSITKNQLVDVLKDSRGAFEEELRVMDLFVPCPPHSAIDLLALNSANQLTVIDLETCVDDALVMRGLAHCEWLQRNFVNIRRMYPGQTIELSSPIQLFLIAPRFSAVVQSAARQLTPLKIHWVRYHTFDIGSTTGVFFEPAACE